MSDEIIFKHIAFGLYRVVRSSFIFRPEAFIRLSNSGGIYHRICFNLWVRRF